MIVKDLHLWHQYTQGIIDATLVIPPLEKPMDYKRPKQRKARLDLHGLTVNDAYKEAIVFLTNHYNLKTKKAEVITGRSGTIRAEFPIWCECGLSKFIKKIEVKSNNGSFVVILRGER